MGVQENKAFRQMLEEAIGADNASVAFSAFGAPASVAIRLNPFKKTDSFRDAEPLPWSSWGRLLKERPVFTLDPLFHGGAWYVQDSSSMYVGQVLRNVLRDRFQGLGRPVRVLDLCAAPGGKTTDAAASLREFCGNNFILAANEVMKSRLPALTENVALWGDPNVVTLSADPSAFAVLNAWFDIIIADVPCSGEGMFRKDEDAVAMWSEDNVKHCAARQKRILADVWPALSPGGVLIYSTCTFNRLENDGNVEWVAAELGAGIAGETYCEAYPGVLRTEHGCSLVPGFVPGEGQYCSVLIKDAEGSFGRSSRTNSKTERKPSEKVLAPIENYFTEEVELNKKGDLVKAVPKVISQEIRELESNLRLQTSGCAAGVLKGRDFVPDADLALSYILADGVFPDMALDREGALSFLRKENLPGCEDPKGYMTVSYKGVRLGFVKNLGNRCNNLHPQSRRIRMR